MGDGGPDKTLQEIAGTGNGLVLPGAVEICNAVSAMRWTMSDKGQFVAGMRQAKLVGHQAASQSRQPLFFFIGFR